MPVTVTVLDASGGIDVYVGRGDTRPVAHFTFTFPADTVTPTNLQTTAGGVDVTSSTAKGDSQPKAATAQPDFPRNVQLVTSGFTSNTDIVVTVVGTGFNGELVTEAITLPMAGSTTQGARVFRTVTSVTWTTPAGWSAGTFKVQTGANATVTFTWRAVGGTAATTRPCTIISASNRTAYYEFQSVDDLAAGSYEAWCGVQWTATSKAHGPGTGTLLKMLVTDFG